MTASRVLLGRHESHKPMKKQTVAFSVMPAVPWGTEERCIVLEAGFARQLLGLCGVLTLYRMWDGTDEEIALVQAQVEKGIAALMGCGCSDGIATIRTNKAGYQESVDEDGNVTILGDTYSTDDFERFPQEQPVDLPTDNICAGSRMLVERMLGDVLFALDQAQFMVDGFKTGTEGLTLLLKTIPLVNVTMGEAYDAWQEWVLSAASLTISTLKIAFGDPAVKDKMTENIYCAVMDSPNHMFTEEIYFDATNDLPLLVDQSTILARFLAGFEVVASGDIFESAVRWFALGALNEDNTCSAEFDCDPEWCLTIDLTAHSGLFGVQPYAAAGGVWNSGVGWQATEQFAEGGYHHNIAIGTAIPECEAHSLEIEFSYSSGVKNGDGTFPWYLGTESGACSSPATVNETSPWVCDFSTGVATGIIIQIPVGVDTNPTGGSATLTRLTMRGTGIPPEIDNWELCEE